MTNIKFIECEYNFMNHEMWDFFCNNQDTTKFLVKYIFLLNKNKPANYGILETHHDSDGNGICTLNDDFMYHWGDYFVITGYCPIKIEE